MIKAIAFDLDDTLLNTTEILIPFAIRRIYDLLCQKGFKESFEVFNQNRISFVGHSSHREFFKHTVASNPQLLTEPGLADVLIQYFYQPEIPEKMPLIEGAKENLEILSSKYKLYVVTSGVEPTQKRKIKALGLECWIPVTNQFIVDGNGIKTKKQAFEMLLKKESISPSELLSFGNRLSQEIRMAKEIGAQTCYFQFGEHAHDIPKDDFEKADFTIQTQKEFITKCRL